MTPRRTQDSRAAESAMSRKYQAITVPRFRDNFKGYLGEGTAMKSRTKTLLLITALTTLFFGSLVGAGPSNGIQHSDWTIPIFGGGTPYIPCVGESLGGTIHVTTRSHNFDTPSGNFHLVESFYGTVYMYSATSSNTWIGHFAIPQIQNTKIKQGETYRYIERGNYVPDEGNGRHFFFDQTWIFTVNANGELNVVSEFPDDPFDSFRCVGKPM